MPLTFPKRDMIKPSPSGGFDPFTFLKGGLGGLPSLGGSGDAGPAFSSAAQEIFASMNNPFAVAGQGATADATARMAPVDFGGQYTSDRVGFDQPIDFNRYMPWMLGFGAVAILIVLFKGKGKGK